MLGGKGQTLTQRRWSRAVVITSIASLVGAALLTTSSRAQVAQSEWLELLNTYRAIAGVSPTKEDPRLSDASSKHAFYVVANGQLSIDESPDRPGYTPEGDAVAPVSIQMGVANPSFSDEAFVEGWLTTVFYGPLTLNPEMLYVGFGSFRDGTRTPIKAAAVMDVNRGATEDDTYARYPVPFPGDGSVVPLTTAFQAEQPDPLSACPGYSRPVGLPISLQLKKVESVISYSLTRDGVEVEACAFDPTSYTNPDVNAQRIGRSFLRDRRAIVVMPRSTLSEGSTYGVSITTESGTYAWSFSIGDDAIAPPWATTGSAVADELEGSGIDDVMFGADGGDSLLGFAGVDSLYGGEGSDQVSGQSGNDLVSGGLGGDRLDGGDGNDVVDGGDGNDVLKGGPGKNKLSGGKGKDTCITSSRKDILESCEVVKRRRAH